MGRFFNARVPRPVGMFVLNRNELPLAGPRGQRVEAVMVRVRQQ